MSSFREFFAQQNVTKINKTGRNHRFLPELVKSGTTHIILGHLSKENNFPELAYQTVAEELMQAGADISNIKLSVANRNEPGKMIIV